MDKDFSKYYKVTDKEFWRNYWFYYRVHTIVGVIAAILIISTVIGVVTRVDPDITLMHIGGGLFPEEQIPQVEAYLNNYVPDLDEDGRSVSSFQTLLFNEEVDPQMAYASMTKADLEFSGGDSTLFLMDADIAQRYINMGGLEDLSEFVEKDGIAPDRLLYNEDGSQPFLVNVMDTELIAQSGYQGPDLYMGIRIIPQNMQKKKIMIKRAEASRMLFETIIADIK